MNLIDYFQELPKSTLGNSWLEKTQCVENQVLLLHQTKDLNFSDIDLAIFGVNENRNSLFFESNGASENILLKFRNLGAFPAPISILELGMFKTGKTLKDTYEGLQEVCEFLLKKNILPICIGGTQDLTNPMLKALLKLNETANLTTVDARIDFSAKEGLFDHKSYLSDYLKSKIIANYANLSTQKYLNDYTVLQFLKERHYESYRLGLIRNNIREIEPILRDTHVLSIDLSSIKHSDAPATFYSTTNGLNSDEICQIARYAGLSNKLMALGIFEYDAQNDLSSMSAELAAQIIWHFCEGFYDRKKVLPQGFELELKKYIVNIEGTDNELVFYQSPVTGHWWFGIPVKENEKLVACSASDYKLALANEIPERWWLHYKKLNFK